MKLAVPLIVMIVALFGFVFLTTLQTPAKPNVAATFAASTTRTQTSILPAASSTTSTTTPQGNTSLAGTAKATSTPKKAVNKPKKQAPPPTPPVTIARSEQPYSSQPLSFETIDASTREALVNILCMPRGGTLRPISGSGIMIDPRGVILTNAHVAQYVLLSENSQVNLTCTIRTGSPAQPRWKAAVLFIPPVWVNNHYMDINASHVEGTGEHDYALLLITSDSAGGVASGPFPYLPVDARENIAFEGDAVLGAGYPAEFVGGIMAQQGLYAVSSISSIKQLLTFQTSSVDVLSIGGVIEAQGGSSGGPVVNAWRYIVGIITTTSDGPTTAERDLHALTLDYINRDITLQAGQSLQNILAGDIDSKAGIFSRETAPNLIQKYIDYLSH